MLYLDYLLYIVIIIFLIVLINKVLDKKEGFVHKGEGVVYTPKEYSSVIKSAVYGTFINGPKDCIDVKPILDKLIASATDSTVVSENTFSPDNPVDVKKGKTKYLIINFTTPNITVSDANFKMPFNTGNGWEKYNNGFVWVEGDPISLIFGDGEGNPAWLSIVSAVYKISELFAYIVIRMPYQFLNQLLIMGIEFMKNFKDILDPIFDFFRQMKAIGFSIIREIFAPFKALLKDFSNILKDLPKFLKSLFKPFIEFLKTAVTKTFSFLKKLVDVIKKILEALIQLPLTIFDILEKLVDVLINVVMIIINIPTSILNMIIGMQNIVLEIMEKTPTIPFLDLFFK